MNLAIQWRIFCYQWTAWALSAKNTFLFTSFERTVYPWELNCTRGTTLDQVKVGRLMWSRDADAYQITFDPAKFLSEKMIWRFEKTLLIRFRFWKNIFDWLSHLEKRFSSDFAFEKKHLWSGSKVIKHASASRY